MLSWNAHISREILKMNGKKRVNEREQILALGDSSLLSAWPGIKRGHFLWTTNNEHTLRGNGDGGSRKNSSLYSLTSKPDGRIKLKLRLFIASQDELLPSNWLPNGLQAGLELLHLYTAHRMSINWLRVVSYNMHRKSLHVLHINWQ